MKPRYNPYKYRLPRPFLGSSDAFLRTAKGQDPADDPTDDIAIGDVRCRPGLVSKSWVQLKIRNIYLRT